MNIRRSLLAVAFATAPASLAAQSLSAYDVFVFQNFTHTNSETNTRLAVGGNANMESWAVGKFLPSDYSDFSFVVRGNLTRNNGSVAHGRTYVGGTVTSDYEYGEEGPPQPSPVDFDSEIIRLTGVSNAYAALTPNGTTRLYDRNPGNELQFVGTSSTLNVFEVTVAMLQESTAGYAFLNPNYGAYNVVNVVGSTSQLSAFNNNGYFFDCLTEDRSSCETGSNFATPTGAGRTVWNFVLDAPQSGGQFGLEIGGPLHGNVLAVNGAVNFGRGDVVGDVVVHSATSSAEYYTVADYTTPEPATFGLMAVGMLGIAGLARRRKSFIRGTK